MSFYICLQPTAAVCYTEVDQAEEETIWMLNQLMGKRMDKTSIASRLKIQPFVIWEY